MELAEGFLQILPSVPERPCHLHKARGVSTGGGKGRMELSPQVSLTVHTKFLKTFLDSPEEKAGREIPAAQEERLEALLNFCPTLVFFSTLSF